MMGLRLYKSDALFYFTIFIGAYFSSSQPGQNGRYLADDIFQCIFMNENFCIAIQILLKFVPKGQIDNKSALVQKWLGAKRRQDITRTNVNPVHRCIYAALGGDELIPIDCFH